MILGGSGTLSGLATFSPTWGPDPTMAYVCVVTGDAGLQGCNATHIELVPSEVLPNSISTKPGCANLPQQSSTEHDVFPGMTTTLW
jgi:hypothetical protein